MIKIAPSILSADFANLERDIGRISTADYVHVDVMDGMFVPNITIGIPVVRCIRPTTTLPLDVHLMIVKPARYVEEFCDAGADIVTVHVESDTPEGIQSAIDKIHAKGKRAGIVLKPATPAQAAEPFLEQVEMVLVMTVEPGFAGRSSWPTRWIRSAPCGSGSTSATPAANWRWTAAWTRRHARSVLRPVPMFWWQAALSTRLPTSPPGSHSCGGERMRL